MGRKAKYRAIYDKIDSIEQGKKLVIESDSPNEMRTLISQYVKRHHKDMWVYQYKNKILIMRASSDAHTAP